MIKMKKILDFYFKHYKRLFFIPIAMLVIAFVIIGLNVANTGDFINKGISLVGGTTFTVEDVSEDAISEIENLPYETNVRVLRTDHERSGVIIETEATEIDDFLEILKADGASYTVETMGSSLGESFFRQTFRALIIAFIFMAIVVFLYFKAFAPSIAVVLAALSDMVITVAIVDLMGMKLGTAGIAAFLMLIGYSVDTDILLTTKVLHSKNSEIRPNMIRAMKTGLTMTATTIVAVIVALIITNSEVITQIMTILLIGLLIDILNTWLQNAAIIRWYVEKKNG